MKLVEVNSGYKVDESLSHEAGIAVVSASPARTDSRAESSTSVDSTDSKPILEQAAIVSSSGSGLLRNNSYSSIEANDPGTNESLRDETQKIVEYSQHPANQIYQTPPPQNVCLNHF
jgi:hypothetical protein